ncbi:MAG: Uma2 family endonuclease [Dehalococcoidia bacterium]|nr:Uma2 family endonuclease [Dehalococcoidia bacterium]
MTLETSTRLLTAEEFAELPGDPRGWRSELVCGRVREMPPAGARHGLLASRLICALSDHSSPGASGAVLARAGYVIRRNPDVVRGPDVSFIAAAAIPEGGLPDGYVEGPPSLAIEVVSPHDLDRDVAEKLAQWLEAGTPVVWVVRPKNNTVTVHRPNGDAHTYGGTDVLTSADAGFAAEGFALPLAELFA